MSVAAKHDGHFGASNSFTTAEDGSLIAECMFGSNHVAVLSNNPHHGNLGHGVYLQGDEGSQSLLLDVNGSRDGVGGAGCTLVLCSGWESGVDCANMVHAAYMLRSGYKDDVIQKVLLRGDDKWEFSANGSILEVEGPNRSTFAVYHNREGFMEGSGDGVCRAWHTETMDGSDSTEIAGEVDQSGLFLILCSHSSGVEDSTAAAMYIVSITDGTVVMTEPYIQSGQMYGSTDDLWKFEITRSTLKATGPKGPCRYAVMSNLKKSDQSQQPSLGRCLATGLNEPNRGAATINEESVIGWLTGQHEVIIKIDGKPITSFPAALLKQDGDKFAFHRAWESAEKTHGMYMVAVYCVITGTGLYFKRC